MNAKVDVLAVMDCAANTMRDMKCANRDLADVQAAALRQASAAVAELVEAARLTCSTWPKTAEVCGLRAALAKFGDA